MKEKFRYDDEDLDLSSLASVTIPPLSTSQIASLSSINGPYPSLNVGAAGSTYTTGSAGSNGTFGIYSTNSTSPWGNITMTNNHQPSSLKVKGDAEFEGKVMINKRDLGEFMETISKRLAILVPDPAKLEHFEALKKAYDHYKMLEQLCELPKEEKE